VMCGRIARLHSCGKQCLDLSNTRLRPHHNFPPPRWVHRAAGA
jgi:hypothetical protein